MKRDYRILALKIMAPVLAIILASLLSSFVIIAINKSPWQVFYTMFKFSFRRVDSVAIILYNSTPLIFSGLAVSIGFKMGLFNIGIEGQYLMGTFLAALMVAENKRQRNSTSDLDASSAENSTSST
jgi:simple sugar transport system permease protein